MSNHPSARRETPDGFRTPPPCPEPTPHLQGTPGKIAVLAARAAAGVALFHPDDNTGED